MEISEKQFALVCYLALMSGGDGFLGKHPNYMTEKLIMLDAGYDAYGFLDSFNQARVREFLKKWGYKLPAEISNLDKSNKFEVDFGSGIKIRIL